MRLRSYAQNFEDVVLWRALRQVSSGLYVDVGAQHPRVDSVSRGFYEQGWRGVHVEPVAQYVDLLRADRPDEIVLPIALGASEGMLELNVIADTGLSTAVADYAARHASEHGFQALKVEVPVLPMRTALAFLHGRDVHWLKIDVEGLEEQVLKGWDSRTFRPWIIVVEATVPLSTEPSYTGADTVLTEAGYSFVYFDGLNRFYLSPDHPELRQHFGVAPNVFDDFQLSGNSHWIGEITAERQQDLERRAADLERAQKQIQRLTLALEVSDLRLSQSMDEMALAHARVAQAELLSAQSQSQLVQAQTQAEQARQHLKHVLQSTSWRISWPVRVLGAPFRRLTSAIRDGRLASGTKRRVKSAMGKMARRIVQVPALHRTVVTLLDLHPPTRRRIGAMLAPPPAMTVAGCDEDDTRPWRPLTVSDLSPQATRNYEALLAAQDAPQRKE